MQFPTKFQQLQQQAKILPIQPAGDYSVLALLLEVKIYNIVCVGLPNPAHQIIKLKLVIYTLKIGGYIGIFQPFCHSIIKLSPPEIFNDVRKGI